MVLYTCKTCEKIYSNKTRFTSHMLTHINKTKVINNVAENQVINTNLICASEVLMTEYKSLYIFKLDSY